MEAGSRTVLGIGPGKSNNTVARKLRLIGCRTAPVSLVNQVTGHLKLLWWTYPLKLGVTFPRSCCSAMFLWSYMWVLLRHDPSITKACVQFPLTTNHRTTESHSIRTVGSLSTFIWPFAKSLTGWTPPKLMWHVCRQSEVRKLDWKIRENKGK